MSCHHCEGSEKGLRKIKFAPAALFIDSSIAWNPVLDRKVFVWLKELADDRKFVLSVDGNYAQFDYCPGCGEKFDYMKWIRELWDEFGDLPMNPETEEIECDWLIFKSGTFREDIWHWFEETFDISVAEDLMYF